MKVTCKKRKPIKPHWYFITYTECPVCGRQSTERERRYTKRPKSPFKRHEFVEDKFCYCLLGGY